MPQLPLDFARALGDAGMKAAAASAEKTMHDFSRRSAEYMLSVLVTTRAEMTGEQLVDRCKAAGFLPRDDRAFGAAFRILARIGGRVVGYAPRTKGHGSAGGKVYGI